MARIFISYRRVDSTDATGRIYDRLVHAFGTASVFKDVDSIPPGADFAEVIAERLADCTAVIVVIGRSWLVPRKPGGPPRLHDPADLVRLEVEHALRKRLLVIPALIGNAHMPGANQLPESIRRLATRNAVSVRPDPDFHRDMDRLIEALRGHLGEPIQSVVPEADDAPATSSSKRQAASRRKLLIGCFLWLVFVPIALLVGLYFSLPKWLR